MKFFVYQQVPDLRITGFDFPVKVEKGSWKIVVGGLLFAYGIKAAQKMAENDFAEVSMKDLIKKALIAIQWVIKIGKHLGDLTIKKFENVKFKDDNKLIGIRNAQGEYLYVPKEYLKLYVAANPSLLHRVSEIVEEERSLSVGVYEDGVLVEETITRRHRQLFTHEITEDGDQLFPELVHGQKITIDGEVTRGNEMTNTIGIGYKGHILTGIPESGSIVRFKYGLFTRCRVYGSVSRLDEKGRLNARKPKIIVSRIESLKNETQDPSLFS